MSPTMRFLRRFIQSPQAIGSIAPSSPSLVNAMLSGIPWHDVGTVVELGAGTGVITAQINCLRSPTSRFLCFENDPDMHRELCRKYPEVILERDAFGLGHSLEKHGVEHLDCVVCGLPLANFSADERYRLVADIHQRLKPGGVFVAFQYTRLLQPFLASTYEQIDRQFVWANVPPAYVYVCRK